MSLIAYYQIREKYHFVNIYRCANCQVSILKEVLQFCKLHLVSNAMYTPSYQPSDVYSLLVNYNYIGKAHVQFQPIS